MVSEEPSLAAPSRRGVVSGEDSLIIGILALQGSFALHRRALERLGARTRLVRRVAELEGLDGLIIPGGESTVMSQLARENGLFDALRAAGDEGLPVLGTCAGAILMARHVSLLAIVITVIIDIIIITISSISSSRGIIIISSSSSRIIIIIIVVVVVVVSSSSSIHRLGLVAMAL